MMEKTDIKKEDFFFSTCLFGIGMILIGLAELLPNGWIYGLLGAYAWYRGIIEITFYKNGFNMPNAWKIVVVTIIVIGLNVFMLNYMTIEGIVKLLEFLATLEWTQTASGGVI